MGSWGSQEKTLVASVCREESQNASVLSRLSCSILNCSHKTLDPQCCGLLQKCILQPFLGHCHSCMLCIQIYFQFCELPRAWCIRLGSNNYKDLWACTLETRLFLKADSPNLILFFTFLGILAVIRQLSVSDAYILESILIYLYVSVCKYVHMHVMYVGVLRGQRGNESPAAGITDSRESPDMDIGEQIWASGRAPSTCSQSHFPGLDSYILSILVYFSF